MEIPYLKYAAVHYRLDVHPCTDRARTDGRVFPGRTSTIFDFWFSMGTRPDRAQVPIENQRSKNQLVRLEKTRPSVNLALFRPTQYLLRTVGAGTS